MKPLLFIAGLFLLITSLQKKPVPAYDTIIRNGLVYNGNGGKPFRADIGIRASTLR